MKIHRYFIGIVFAAFAAALIVGWRYTNQLAELEEWDLVYISGDGAHCPSRDEGAYVGGAAINRLWPSIGNVEDLE